VTERPVHRLGVTATLAAGLLCRGLARTLRGSWRATGIAAAVC
jgi:hypothetical protein